LRIGGIEMTWIGTFQSETEPYVVFLKDFHSRFNKMGDVLLTKGL